MQCPECPLHLKCVTLGRGKGPETQCSKCDKVQVHIAAKVVAQFVCPYLLAARDSSVCAACVPKLFRSMHWEQITVYDLDTPRGRTMYQLRTSLPGKHEEITE